MERDSPIIAKTKIPNSIIIWVGMYVTIMGLIVWNAEKWEGPIFYAVILAGFIYWAWTIRCKYDCLLLLTNWELIVDYYHPGMKETTFDIKNIKSDIFINRSFMGLVIGGFPKLQDFVNYKWYFMSEIYYLEFLYGDQEEQIKIKIQPNIIGFENFMNKVVQQTNFVINEKEHKDSVGGALVKSLISLIV